VQAESTMSIVGLSTRQLQAASTAQHVSLSGHSNRKSDGFGFIARVTESLWVLSYLMQICIKAAFSQTQPG